MKLIAKPVLQITTHYCSERKLTMWERVRARGWKLFIAPVGLGLVETMLMLMVYDLNRNPVIDHLVLVMIVAFPLCILALEVFSAIIAPPMTAAEIDAINNKVIDRYEKENTSIDGY